MKQYNANNPNNNQCKKKHICEEDRQNFGVGVVKANGKI